MVDYTENDLRVAGGIINRLVPERSAEIGSIDEGLSITDLQRSAEIFFGQLSLVEYAGAEFPAVRLGEEYVPFALWQDGTVNPPWRKGQDWRFLHPIDLNNLVEEEVRGVVRRFGDAAKRLSPDEARETFLWRAKQFLATRIAGVRSLRGGGGGPGGPPPSLTMSQFWGGPPTSVPGCLFSVHARSHGLSAYWSGAYLIISNNHATPTSPATAPLQAGTYVFGVDGGAYGNVVQWDTNKVCTLPGPNSVHLPF